MSLGGDAVKKTTALVRATAGCVLLVLMVSCTAPAHTLTAPSATSTLEPVAELPSVTRDPPPSLEILLPLYSYPNWWEPAKYIWDDVAAANKQVPITAIINPDSGPGGCPPNSDYQRGIADLRAGGVTMLGYVHTSWCQRDMETIKGDIDLYDACFGIDGIFLDQVEGGSCSSADCCDWYEQLIAYVKAGPNLDLAHLNPGMITGECYYKIPTCDTIVLFEDFATDWPGYRPCSCVTHHPAGRSSMLVHSESDADTMKSHIDLALLRNVRYVFITDLTLPNPYDGLPSYWQVELDYIESTNRGAVPTLLQVGLPMTPVVLSLDPCLLR